MVFLVISSSPLYVLSVLSCAIPTRQTFFNDLRALTQTVLRQLGPPSDLYA
ncbi:protein of unknown function [Limnospira indica PCC 8005]|uniref:Uncharacterized protein n=1 Tax=Limnospira indica PCC 8005 TaxID=376219 RepID=A0A9P1P133_9CYAN|nr:protein of unknown function [Limnospira indica PCC 8005]